MADGGSKPSFFELAIYKKAFFKLTASGAIFRGSDASISAASSSSSPSSSRTTFTPPGSAGAVGLAIAIATALPADSTTTSVTDAARRSELKSMARALAAASFDPHRCVALMNVIIRELSEDYTVVIRHLDENTTVARVHFTGEDSRTIVEAVVQSREPPPPPPFRVAEFLRNCLLCGNKLDGKDAYIYKGEKAFCSDECRQQHIIDERKLAISSSSEERENQVALIPSSSSSPVVFELGTSTP